MSKILRRPMFRGGVVSSYGNGIATGLADGGRVGYNVGGPIYPAGYSAAPGTGITGADIKNMAEKKVFTSGFGKDTAQLNSTLKDLYMNYIQSPLEKGGNRFIDYMAGTEFEDKDSPFFGNQKDFKRIYERDVLPLASEMSAEMIPQISSEGEYEEAYMTPEEVKLRNEQRKKSYIDNPVYDAREQAIMDQEGLDQVKAINDRKRREEEEANRIRPGGQDASQDDFEIPVGVTEVEGEETVDGGAVGYKELADSYFEAMSQGSDERLAERLAAADERSAERLKKARIGDLSDLGLNIFAKSQKPGATVGTMLGSAAEDLIAKPSRSEKEKDRGDLRREKLEDAAANREEGRFDAATQMAFKQMMTEKGFDFKDLQSEKSLDAAMERLKLQLETTKDVAKQKIIAGRIRDLEQLKSKVFAPGITEKNTKYLMSLTPGSREHTIALAEKGYPSNIFSKANDAMTKYGLGAGSEYTVDDVLADGALYYKDWGGLWKNDGTQEDGVYFIEETSEILKVEDGTEVFRKPISITKPTAAK